MNILQLCNKAPYPPKDGGAIAILNLSKAFADNGHRVTVLAMNTTKHNVNAESIPGKYSSKIDFIYVPADTRIQPFKLIYNLLFSSFPYNAERFIRKNFSEKIIFVLTNATFDIVQLEGLYLTPYIPVVRKYSNAKISYRAHNVESEIWSRIASTTGKSVKKLYFRILANRMAEFEKSIINKYDLLIPITERDLRHLIRMGNQRPCKVTPAGISDSYYRETSYSGKSKSIFYLGALDWIPNQEGLIWFIDTVWKKLKTRNPSITFHLAGRNAPKWLIKKCIENSIIYHGEIENTRDYFDQHQIMVVPLFAGGGLRVKIIEAMARSKVVVTTPIGSEGLYIEDGVHAIIAETSESFLAGIEILLQNPEFFSKLEKNSYALAKQKYNNATIAAELMHFYNRHITC
jgi:glycosyltransferase involved in cell wall biosynthesis